MHRAYLLSYDISDSKTLRHMHKLAKSFGSPVQYSVFLCYLDRSNRVRLASEIDLLINLKSDRVIIIDLGGSDSSWIPDFQVFGRQTIERPRTHIVI